MVKPLTGTPDSQLTTKTERLTLSEMYIYGVWKVQVMCLEDVSRVSGRSG